MLMHIETGVVAPRSEWMNDYEESDHTIFIGEKELVIDTFEEWCGDSLIEVVKVDNEWVDANFVFDFN